jgi:hypothetical protein
MKIFTTAAAGALLVVATLLPATAAGAESYSNPDTPNVGSHDSGAPGGSEVLPSDAEKPVAEEGTSGAPAGAEVLPASAEAPAAAAAETAPSGTLPFTGGDVVGMTVIGLGAIGLGTVLVRRSRKESAQTA